MKQKLLLKTMLLLCALVAGSSNVWATDPDVTYNFSSFESASTVTLTADNGDLTVTLAKNNGNNNPAWSSNQARVYAKGSLKVAVSSPTKKISKIVYTYVVNANKNGVTPTIDGVSGKTNAGTWDAENKTWTGEDAEVTFSTSGDAGNVGFTKIEVYYKIDNRTAVNITSFTADATTIQIGNTVNTNVSVDQDGWTESYEYESDDTDIATVDTDGKITAVAAGTATITVSLNMNPSDANYKAGATTSKNIEITVVENPVHTATLNINGQTSVQYVEEEAAITFPVLTTLGGLNFLGWTTAPIVGKVSVAPAVLVTSANMGNADITYYAVFGKTAIITDVLTQSTTGVTGTSYTDFSNKKASSDAVYAGNCAGNNSSIQLRSNNSNSGVITTTSGGKATKVVVTWQSDTQDGRTLNVYGKNTAYESASDLYNNTNQGTLIGTIVKGTSTELTISTDYEYIGVRSASGAMYLSDLSITWNTGGDNEYCTSVTETITINAACNDGAGNYYGTYSCSSAFVVPAGLTVSEINVDESQLAVTDYDEGDIVPANTGVMVSSTTSGDHVVYLAFGGTSVLGSDNMLKPSGDAGITASAMTVASTKFYRLTMHKGTDIGFWWGAASGAAFDLAANKAYLAVPESALASAPSMLWFDNGSTGVDEVRGKMEEVRGDFFDLQGRKVANPTKGLYIVNGKKVVIK